MVDDQNVDREAEGAQQHEQVAEADCEGLGDAQQVHARDGQRDRRPDAAAHPLAAQQAEQRDDDDVKRGDKPGLADRGVGNADLLERAGDRQHNAAAHAAQHRPLLLRRRLAAVQPVKQENTGQQHQPAQQTAHAVEGKRADIVHADRLGYEGHAPDQGGREQHEVGAQAIGCRHNDQDSLKNSILFHYGVFPGQLQGEFSKASV